MKFNLTNQDEAIQASNYFARLMKNKSLVEIKRISPNRSIRQNAYLHVLLGAFGQHFGYTMDEAKLIYKTLNDDIYKYTKTVRNKSISFYRSSSDLTVDEMTKSIEVLRIWSDKAGYPLPDPDNGPWIRQLQNAIEQTKNYL